MKPPARPVRDDEARGRLNDSKTLPGKQGYRNPGPTANLRGVEDNTARHKGSPNPTQHGTPGDHGPFHGEQNATGPHFKVGQ